MNIERHGNGENIYLALHGWGTDRRIFAPLLELVPQNATFYTADLPGVSLSPAPSEWTVTEIVREILDVISKINSSRITIVGHCGGSIFGLVAVIQDEKSIERIVMIDPFAYLPRYFKVFLNDAIGGIAYKTTFANPIGRWITNQALRNHRQDNSDLTESFSTIDHEVARKYLALFAEMESIKIPEDLAVKVDLVYGEKSFSAVKKSVASLRKSLPKSQVWKLDNAAHLPMEEATKQLCEILFEPETC